MQCVRNTIWLYECLREIFLSSKTVTWHYVMYIAFYNQIMYAMRHVGKISIRIFLNCFTNTALFSSFKWSCPPMDQFSGIVLTNLDDLVINQYRKRPGYYRKINSFWPDDVIQWNRIGSALLRVMVCCLEAPDLYMNQISLIVSDIFWRSTEGHFTKTIKIFLKWVS